MHKHQRKLNGYKSHRTTEQHLGTSDDNSLRFTPLVSGACYRCSTVNIGFSCTASYRHTLKNVRASNRHANGRAYARRPLTFYSMYQPTGQVQWQHMHSRHYSQSVISSTVYDHCTCTYHIMENVDGR